MELIHAVVNGSLKDIAIVICGSGLFTLLVLLSFWNGPKHDD